MSRPAGPMHRAKRDELESLRYQEMIKKAEEMKKVDDAAAARVESKNKLEGYAYQVKTSLSDAKVASKVSQDDIKRVQKAVDDTLDWVSKNESAEVDEFQDKQKSLESLVNPIMAKMYAGQGPQPQQSGASTGPQPASDDVDELD